MKLLSGNWTAGPAVKEYRYDSILLLGMVLVISSFAIYEDKAFLLAGLSGLIVATAIAFINFELAIITSLAWVFLQYLFTRDLKILPEAFTLIDECFLFGLGCYLTWNIALKKIRVKITAFEVALLAFIAIGVISTVLNRNPVINIVAGPRCYLQYIVLFYAVSYLDLTDETCKRILNIILVMVVLQVPLMLYQYITWVPSSLVKDHADSAYGTFMYGASNIMGVLMLVMILFLIKVKKDMPGLIRIPVLVMLCFGMILAQSKIAFLLMAGVGVFEYRTKVFSKKGLLGAAVATLFLALVIKVAMMVSDDITYLLSPEKFSILIANQLTDKEGGGRVLYFILTLGILYKYAYSPFIGLGPAMYSSYAGISSKSRYLTNVLGLDLEKRGTRLDPELTGVIGEYGFLGAALISVVIGVLFFRSLKVAKYHPDPYWASYASWLTLFTLIFFSGGFANGLWQAQFFAANFWIAAGIMNRQYMKINMTSLAG